MSSSRQGKGPEKSNFVQTCNLLSRHIKEKRSLRDLSIEIGGKVESLQNIVKPGSTSAPTTMDILTDKGKSVQPSIQKQPSMALDSKTAQLTIFYSGRVLAFDDYPAEKAKELMAFARNESSHMHCGILSNTTCGKHNPGLRQRLPPPPPPQPQPQKPACISSNTGAQRFSLYAETSGSDLPIARRSSLHRFIEKRKERAAVRWPYQVQEQPASSTKGDEQLELKL